MRIIPLAALCLYAALGAGAQTQGLRVGAASAVVTPPEGCYMAGYMPNRKATRVHDDLFAKAVVFDDGVKRAALVVVDCIGLQYDTVQALRRAVAAKGVDRLAPSAIIVQSTHTHCGPDVIGIWGPDWDHSGRDPQYEQELVAAMARQVAAAAEALVPVDVRWTETECVGWAVNDSEPDVLDNAVVTLQCVDKAGRSVATLTNFPCHPTVINDKEGVVSADWVGYYYKKMAAALPGEHLYLQGAIGCWIQPKAPERSWAEAQHYGEDLAAHVLDALETAQPLAATRIRHAAKPFAMPITPGSLFALFAAKGVFQRGVPGQLSIDTEVAWLAVGPAQFATHPGETAPVFAEETRALMDSGPRFVLGLGLDELGYICPERYFDHPEDYGNGEYLTRMSPGREAGAAMMAALRAVIP